MDLQEVLSSIENEETKEAIISLVEAEKEKGISSYRKKDSEVLKLKNTLKELGYDHEKYSNVDEFIEDTKKVKDKVSKSSLTIAQLNDKLNDITSQLDSEREAAANAKRLAKENKLTAELTKNIGKDFIGSEYLIKDLISEGRVDLVNNEVVFKEGDDIITFDKGLVYLKEKNKGMLRTNIKSGTGDVGGNTIEPKEDEFTAKLRKALGQ